MKKRSWFGIGLMLTILAVYVLAAGTVTTQSGDLTLAPASGKVGINGSLGVGTASPDALFHVYKGSPGLIAKFTQIVEGGRDYSPVLIYNGNPASTSGTAPLRVGDSAGASIITTENVGVGTATPAKRLDVVGSGDVDVAYFRPDANGRGIYLVPKTTAVTEVLMGATSAGQGGAGIIKFTNINHRDHTADIRFWTRGAGDALTILNNGNVGVGTTTPGDKLHVAGGVTAQTFIGDRTAAGSNSYLALKNSQGANTVLLDTKGSSYFNGGNVGVGTTSPASQLHLQKAGGDLLKIERTGSDAGSWNFEITQTGTNDRGSLYLVPSASTADFVITDVNGKKIFYLENGGELKIDGSIYATNLAGGGYAYACIDSYGKIFRSSKACDQL